MVLKCSVEIMCIIQSEMEAKFWSKVKDVLCRDICESLSYLRSTLNLLVLMRENSEIDLMT